MDLRIECQAANNQGVPCGAEWRSSRRHRLARNPLPTTIQPGARSSIGPFLSSPSCGENLVPVSSEFNWNIHCSTAGNPFVTFTPCMKKFYTRLACEPGKPDSCANYAVQAWIDVSCRVQHFHLQEEECAIQTRGRVHDKFERKGDHFIELDLAVFSPSRCLATIRYTAIFRIAPNAA